MSKNARINSSVNKSALSTVAAIVLTAIIVGSGVGGAGFFYASNAADAGIAELRSANDKTNSQLGVVQDENSKSKSIINDLNKKLSELNAVQDDNSKLKSQVNDLNKKVSELNERAIALQKGALVSFEFIPKPENLNYGYKSVPAGVKVSFLKFTTVDGVTLNGYIWEPQEKKANFALLYLHGTGGNHSGSPNTANPSVLLITEFPALYSSKGYAVLGINDRQGSPNANKMNLWDVSKDVSAGVSILKSFGYTNIVIVGFSLGGQHAVMYEAMYRDPAVKGLILSAPVSNNPWRIQYRYAGNDPLVCPGNLKTNYPAGLYDKLYGEAKDLVAQGKPNAILPDKMPYLACTPIDINAIAFLTYYSPEGGVTNQWIGKVPVPILYVRDQADSQSQADDAKWMLGNATAPGSLVPSIKLVTMPNTDPPARANHVVSGKNRQLLVDTMLSWLQEMKFG